MLLDPGRRHRSGIGPGQQEISLNHLLEVGKNQQPHSYPKRPIPFSAHRESTAYPLQQTPPSQSEEGIKMQQVVPALAGPRADVEKAGHPRRKKQVIERLAPV